jgi:hypothetical protein
MSDDELTIGSRVWFKVLYCEDTRKGGAYERWRESWVFNITDATVSVRYYETPFNEHRKTLRREDIRLSCPGDPLFSC